MESNSPMQNLHEDSEEEKNDLSDYECYSQPLIQSTNEKIKSNIGVMVQENDSFKIQAGKRISSLLLRYWNHQGPLILENLATVSDCFIKGMSDRSQSELQERLHEDIALTFKEVEIETQHSPQDADYVQISKAVPWKDHQLSLIDSLCFTRIVLLLQPKSMLCFHKVALDLNVSANDSDHKSFTLVPSFLNDFRQMPAGHLAYQLASLLHFFIDARKYQPLYFNPSMKLIYLQTPVKDDDLGSQAALAFMMNVPKDCFEMFVFIIDQYLKRAYESDMGSSDLWCRMYYATMRGQ